MISIIHNLRVKRYKAVAIVGAQQLGFQRSDGR